MQNCEWRNYTYFVCENNNNTFNKMYEINAECNLHSTTCLFTHLMCKYFFFFFIIYFLQLIDTKTQISNRNRSQYYYSSLERFQQTNCSRKVFFFSLLFFVKQKHHEIPSRVNFLAAIIGEWKNVHCCWCIIASFLVVFSCGSIAV